MGTGKKVAFWGCFGCAGIVLLFMFILAGGVGYIAYQGYQFGKGIAETYKEVVEEYQALDTEFPYTPPESGVMDEERLKTYLQMRKEVAIYADEYFNKIEETGEAIGEQFESPGFRSKIRGIGKIREVVSIAVNMVANIAKEHVRQLRSQSMSTLEYRWMTQVYLGTLSKAESQGRQSLAEAWDEYVESFDSAQEQAKNINMSFGNQSYHGKDMNIGKLIDKVKNVEFIFGNADLIEQTIENLLPHENIGILDFVTLHIDEVMKDIASETNGKIPEIGITDIPSVAKESD